MQEGLREEYTKLIQGVSEGKGTFKFQVQHCLV